MCDLNYFAVASRWVCPISAIYRHTGAILTKWWCGGVRRRVGAGGCPIFFCLCCCLCASPWWGFSIHIIHSLLVKGLSACTAFLYFLKTSLSVSGRAQASVWNKWILLPVLSMVTLSAHRTIFTVTVPPPKLISTLLGHLRLTWGSQHWENIYWNAVLRSSSAVFFSLPHWCTPINTIIFKSGAMLCNTGYKWTQCHYINRGMAYKAHYDLQLFSVVCYNTGFLHKDSF